MLEEQNALYGRFLLTIQLKELNYKEVAEFYQSKSVYDKIAFYAVLGGFPYVNGFVDEKKSLRYKKFTRSYYYFSEWRNLAEIMF